MDRTIENRIHMGVMAKSLAGHDRGNNYVVLFGDEKFVYLVDGSARTLQKPKKKKYKHVQLDYTVTSWIQNLIDQNQKIFDSDIIRAIREYEKIDPNLPQ